MTVEDFIKKLNNCDKDAKIYIRANSEEVNEIGELTVQIGLKEGEDTLVIIGA